jgi:hypothetical protein
MMLEMGHEKKTLDGWWAETTFGFGIGWRHRIPRSSEIQAQHYQLSKSGAKDGYALHVRSDHADECPREVWRSPTSAAAGVTMAWSTKFNHPIKWGARTILTLHDARDYILSLPTSKQMLPAWQAATEALLEAAKHGGLWLELARIGMLQALLGPKPITESSSSNKTHWGKRKLARDR